MKVNKVLLTPLVGEEHATYKNRNKEAQSFLANPSSSRRRVLFAKLSLAQDLARPHTHRNQVQ